LPRCGEGKIKTSDTTYQKSLFRSKEVRIMWLLTGSYSVHGLYWLIAVLVALVIAVIALIVAVSALSRARAAGRAVAVYSRGIPGGPGAPVTGPTEPKQLESSRILDERYAKGEISREEYMQRQEDLKPKA
jgi:uncharacterized membrane protein